MSANWSIRSKGVPYFCLRQQNLSGMDAGGIGAEGIVEMSVEFRLFGWPTQLADPSEVHALFSMSTFLLGERIMEIGVTPSGQFAASVFPDSAGPVALSIPGAATLGAWHTLYARWDSGTGDLLLTYDGINNVVANTGLSGPAVRSLCQMMLFNDASGYSRADAAIRSAWMSFFDLTTMGEVHYAVNEKAGAWLRENRTTVGSYPSVGSFDLKAEYYQLSRVRPWGPPPSDTEPSSEAYGWMVKTEHAEATPATTRHTEVAIT